MNPFSYAKRLLAETFGAEPEVPAQSPDPYAALTARAAPAPPFNPMDPMGTMNHFGFGDQRQPTLQVPQEPQSPQMPASGPQSPAKGFLQRMQDTPGMGLGLMQLGAGIASGRDWGEGLGAGISGMADTLQKQKVFDYQQKQQELEMAARQQAADSLAEYRRESLLLKAQGKAGDKAYKPYTITMADGSVIQGSALVTQQGGVAYMDTQGRPVDPSAVKSAVPYQAPSRAGDKERADIISRSPFTLRWIDKKGNERLQAGRQINGEYQLQNEKGEWKPAHEVAGTNEIIPVNKSDIPDVEARAGGLPNAVTYDEATGIPSFNFRREAEAKDYQFALRSVAANRELESLVQNEGQFNALASLGGAIKRYAANNADAGVTATGLSAALKETGHSDQDIARLFSSPAFRFLQGVLRIDTGAAYTGTEINNYWSAFMPTTGDTVEQWYQKGQSRRQEIASLIGRTGAAAPFLTNVVAGRTPIPGSLQQMSRLASGGDPAATTGQTANTNNTGVKFLGFE